MSCSKQLPLVLTFLLSAPYLSAVAQSDLDGENAINQPSSLPSDKTVREQELKQIEASWGEAQANFADGKLDEALMGFNKTVELLSPLVIEGGEDKERLAFHLASLFHARCGVLRTQGNLDECIKGYSQGIEVLLSGTINKGIDESEIARLLKEGGQPKAVIDRLGNFFADRGTLQFIKSDYGLAMKDFDKAVGFLLMANEVNAEVVEIKPGLHRLPSILQLRGRIFSMIEVGDALAEFTMSIKMLGDLVDRFNRPDKISELAWGYAYRADWFEKNFRMEECLRDRSQHISSINRIKINMRMANGAPNPFAGFDVDLELALAYMFRANSYLNNRNMALARQDILKSEGFLLAKGQRYSKEPAKLNQLKLDVGKTLIKFARLLAETLDPAEKDPQAAIDYAHKACELTNWEESDFVRTLALFHAEIGDFDSAVKFQKMALESAKEEDKRELQQRLEEYVNEQEEEK